MTGRLSRPTTDRARWPVRLADGLLTGGIAGFVLTVTAHTMGLTPAVARFVGVDDPRLGWYLTLGLGVLGGACFALVDALAGLRAYTTATERSFWIGLGYGILVWLVAIAVLAPLWTRIVLGAVRPVPYLHWPSFLALVAYGAVLGAVYPLVVTARYW